MVPPPGRSCDLAAWSGAPNIPRRTVVQRLVMSLMIVESHPARDALLKLWDGLILAQVDFFLLDASQVPLWPDPIW